MYFVKAGTAATATTPAVPTAGAWDVYLEFDGNGLPAGSSPIATTKSPLTFGLDAKYASGSPIAVSVQSAVMGGKAKDLAFNLDLSSFSQNSSSSAVLEISQNGSPPGELASVTVSTSGIVQGRYTNGETRDLGQVILATFRNPNGLVSLGDNLWAETIDSGQAAIAGPGDGLNGTIGSGRVEESNVDMSAELVNMIIQQRNYQANAQSIKTQDQILQTLINLR